MVALVIIQVWTCLLCHLINLVR